MTITQFGFPTRILFGPGAIDEAPKLIKAAQAQRPLIITDSGMSELPIVRKLEQLLVNALLSPSTFCDFAGNPIAQHVADGVAAFSKHQADSIVVIGGGAALDVAKAIALMAHNPGDLFDYEDEKPGARTVTEKIPYLIAVPTTAGTGSEVGRSSVISENDSKAKKIIFAPELLPPVVIADPELTLALPRGLTAATGMDALSHCIEAFMAKNYHPICDGIALEGVRLISQSLARACDHPHDLNARSDMLVASMMGAIAFQKGLGVTHSCAHALSTVHDLHHGLANGIMLHACMEFNRRAVPEKFSRLASIVASSNEADDFFNWLNDLRSEIGIPLNLTNADITVSDRLIDIATSDVCHANNPCPVTRDDFEKIFAAACPGQKP